MRVVEACLRAPFPGGQWAMPTLVVGEGALLRIGVVHPLHEQAAMQGNFAV